jgi:hypothetical protein
MNSLGANVSVVMGIDRNLDFAPALELENVLPYMGDVLCKRIACGRFLEAHNFSKTILVILLIKLVFPIAHRGKLLHTDNFRGKTARKNHPKSPPQTIS